MYITQVQSRLRSVFDEETRKRNLVPSKVWQTLDEIDEEAFDIDIEAGEELTIDYRLEERSNRISFPN